MVRNYMTLNLADGKKFTRSNVKSGGQTSRTAIQMSLVGGQFLVDVSCRRTPFDWEPTRLDGLLSTGSQKLLKISVRLCCFVPLPHLPHGQRWLEFCPPICRWPSWSKLCRETWWPRFIFGIHTGSYPSCKPHSSLPSTSIPNYMQGIPWWISACWAAGAKRPGLCVHHLFPGRTPKFYAPGCRFALVGRCLFLRPHHHTTDNIHQQLQFFFTCQNTRQGSRSRCSSGWNFCRFKCHSAYIVRHVLCTLFTCVWNAFNHRKASSGVRHWSKSAHHP